MCNDWHCASECLAMFVGEVKVVGMFIEIKDKSKIRVSLARVAIHSQIVSTCEESVTMIPPFWKALSK